MSSFLIQVCGDPTVDWFRVHNEDVIVRGGVYYWQKQAEGSRVRLSSKPGGAALVFELLKEMLAPQTAQVEGITISEELLNRPKDDRITTSWTVWKEFANPGFDYSSYRLADWQEFEPGNWDYPSARLGGSPDLLVIWDSGLGFRTCREGWPEILVSPPDKNGPKHIIFKLGQYNDGQPNPLLDRIEELGWSERTTIVSSLSDLRSCAVKVGISLSWERMLEEVASAVQSPNCPFIHASGKLKYKQVIIPIGTSGAIIAGQEYNTLIFDRSGQENDFASRFPGQMIGDNACIIATLAAYWADHAEMTSWTPAVYTGIQLARLLQSIGYDVVEQENSKHLQFPYRTIAKAYHDWQLDEGKADNIPAGNLIKDLSIFVDIDNAALKQPGAWTILETTLLKNCQVESYLPDPENTMAVNACARSIVLKGPQTALLDVPLETIGGWYSADRQEIEGVRSVNNAMRDYLKLDNPETPLCVAVFGPPGAGKSFVIKEIARGLGIGNEAQLTFNLSQFDSPSELLNAFHQIRDLNLQGRLPLVFWDEFDTPCEGRPLGWLRYFLAPMQDGEFADQGMAHPLGSGIYVFAGATSHSYEEFRSGDHPDDRAAKKPDFISRLRAYINIRGINGNPNTVEDRLYIVRRAFVLRQYLEANAPQIRNNGQFEIESGVLDAFLLVSKYRHGTRSLENLLRMSSLADKRKYELSSLPPDHIIEMHTNIKEFNDLASRGHREMLKIGIFGHINLDPRQTAQLKQAISKAIKFIEEQFPQHCFIVFSPLAAGGDRLVARELLKIDASRLIPVLPFAQDEYINDFGPTDDYRIDSEGAELRNEFKYWLNNRAIEVIEMPPSPTRREAYLKAGQFIAEHSDIIIPVWDGQTEPTTSVTAHNVARAEELNKPICHIWAANTKQNSSSASMGDRHGSVRCKNFPGQTPGVWKNL